MNFTYKLKRPPDGQWGSLKDNGQWTGMVKELHLKEADIGIYDIYLILACLLNLCNIIQRKDVLA